MALVLLPPVACFVSDYLEWIIWPTGSGWAFWPGVAAGGIVLFEMFLSFRKRCVRGWRRFLWVLLPLVACFVSAYLEWVNWLAATALGILSGVVVAIEMYLWFRKRYALGWRRFLYVPLWPLRWSMCLHVWLGLAAIPLAIMHGGFTIRLSVAAGTLWLFVFVSLSGIWGLYLQQWLPRRLTDDVPDESIVAAMDHVMGQHVDEAQRLVDALTLGLTEAAPSLALDLAAPVDTPDHVRPLTAGAPAERVSAFFEDSIKPYLLNGRKSQSLLRFTDQARMLFQQLRRDLPQHAHPSCAMFERMCETRRQADRQRWLDAWLHGWMLVHVPLAWALVVFLIWHAVTAMKWW